MRDLNLPCLQGMVIGAELNSHTDPLKVHFTKHWNNCPHWSSDSNT